MGRKNEKRKVLKKLRKNPINKHKPIDLFFLFISIVLIIPLIFSEKTMDPDLAPRLLALEIVILALSLFYVTRSLKNRPNFDFVRLPIFILFGLLFIMTIFSTTQAINPTEGLYDIVKTFLTIVLLVYATHVFLVYRTSFEVLTKIIIASSIIATTIGAYQYFEYIPGNSGADMLKVLYSVKGFMAHKNQFVISMFLMLPFTVYGISKFSKFWFLLSILQTLMILLNIVILQTRSVWVATFIFAFIFIALWLVFTLKNKEVSKFISLKQGLIIGVIILIVISGSALIFKKTGTVELLKYKVSSLFDSKSHDNQGRLKMWESTLDLAKDNIFFGVGAGNWKISVLPYYNANFGSNYQNWRRPHNDFLWILSEKGIFALLFYVIIFIVIGIYGLKIILSETNRDKLFLTSLLIAGIGGYFIISMVTFPLERINHQIYITIMMAGIISFYYKKQDNIKEISSPNKSSKIYFWAFICVILLSVTSIYYSITLIRSEVNIQKLIAAKKAEDWKSVIFYANNAITPVTTVDAYSMPIHLHRGIANVKLNNRKQAFKDFQIALGYFPTQIAVLNNLAIVSAEMNNLDNAILYFNKALEIYPNYKVSAWNLVKAYYKKAEYENAYVALLNYSPDNTPDEYDRLKNDLTHRLNTSK